MACRERDYGVLGLSDRLGATVILEPIGRDELDAYLHRLHVPRAAAVRGDGFDELLSTPLGARLLVDSFGEGFPSGNLIDAWIGARLKRERERGGIQMDPERIVVALEQLAVRNVVADPRTRFFWTGEIPAPDEAALAGAERAEILVRTREGDRDFFHGAVFERLAVPALGRMIDELADRRP